MSRLPVIRSIAAAMVATAMALAMAAPAAARGDLFDNTARILSDQYFDRDFRRDTLPGLIEKYRPAADAADSRAAERLIVHEFLSEIPASHLAIISTDEHRAMFNELNNAPQPTFGFELVHLEDGFFVHTLLEEGPADRSGLRQGDRVVSIDGEDVAASDRLGWRSDDAALPDPPIHRVLAEIGDGIRLQVERRPGEERFIDIVATTYSAFEAARESAAIIEHDGEKIAYIHLWFIHIRGVDRMLGNLMRRQFAGAAALVVDLRGRGGSADMAIRIVRLLATYRKESGKPVIVLIDSMTRSAKEVIAFSIRKYGIGTLVGERTAGAVLPAMFERVDEETMLMFPAFKLAQYTDLIEGKGVEPDVRAEAPGPYSAGADPILEAALNEAVRQAGQRRDEHAMTSERQRGGS
jgi:C-terminal processing protease CtpA/Prc